MIILDKDVQQTIVQEAVATFPEACCGFLYGHQDNAGRRFITKAEKITNERAGELGHHINISPTNYLAAEEYAQANQLELLGVYHSHPNHPAIPSEEDRLAAQTFFSYVIISVNNQQAGAIRSWRLNDEAQFEEENNHLIAK